MTQPPPPHVPSTAGKSRPTGVVALVFGIILCFFAFFPTIRALSGFVYLILNPSGYTFGLALGALVVAAAFAVPGIFLIRRFVRIGRANRAADAAAAAQYGYPAAAGFTPPAMPYTAPAETYPPVANGYAPAANTYPPAAAPAAPTSSAPAAPPIPAPPASATPEFSDGTPESAPAAPESAPAAPTAPESDAPAPQQPPVPPANLNAPFVAPTTPPVPPIAPPR